MKPEEAYACLERAASRGSRLGLERVTQLSQILEQPQEKIPVIHIAGLRISDDLRGAHCGRI